MVKRRFLEKFWEEQVWEKDGSGRTRREKKKSRVEAMTKGMNTSFSSSLWVVWGV